MNNINIVILNGRITKDAETIAVGSTKKCIITDAVSRDYKDKEGNYQSDFISCEAWGAVADYLANKARKGDEVYIQGSLRTERYDVDGQSRSRTFVYAEKVKVTKKDKDGNVTEVTEATAQPSDVPTDEELPF